jgi:hypothetical protein
MIKTVDTVTPGEWARDDGKTAASINHLFLAEEVHLARHHKSG